MNTPLLAGSCAACGQRNCPRSHHLNDGPCTTCETGCAGYVDAGVICGCDCDCRTVLTDGNVMEEDVTPREPWEAPDPDEPRVILLICADCYVGGHRCAA